VVYGTATVEIIPCPHGPLGPILCHGGIAKRIIETSLPSVLLFSDGVFILQLLPPMISVSFFRTGFYALLFLLALALIVGVTMLNSLSTELQSARERNIGLQHSVDAMSGKIKDITRNHVNTTASLPSLSAVSNDRRLKQSGIAQSALLALLQSPEAQSLVTARTRTLLNIKYAPLFQQLQLTPPEIDALLDRLIKAQNARVDVAAAASSQGLPLSSKAVVEIGKDEIGPVDQDLKNILGDKRYEEFVTFNTTLPFRPLMDDLASHLYLTDAPLTRDQTSSLLDLLIGTGAAPQDVDWTNVNWKGSAATWRDLPWDTLMPKLEGILSSGQIAVLQTLRNSEDLTAQWNEALQAAATAKNHPKQ